MKNINNKGFTLIELIATILLLALVMGIGVYSISKTIQKNKDSSYQLLIKEIKEAVNTYYQECKFINDNCNNTITLGYLVEQGFLKGNKTNETGANKDKYTLVNPNTGNNIYDCNIQWSYSAGEINITDRSGGNCPSTANYN